jgi:tripartite-type tricarboxylate transporter receptor subunit TctC
MQIPRRQFLRLTASAAVYGGASTIAGAQTYPVRPVRVIVPYPAGGQTDVFARFMSQKLSERFGMAFYVENIVGASGSLGTAQVARAAPDGHTILGAMTFLGLSASAAVTKDPQGGQGAHAVKLATYSSFQRAPCPSVDRTRTWERVGTARFGPKEFVLSSQHARP